MQQRWSAATMWKRVFRPRVLVYGAVLLAIVVAFLASLALRAPFKADIVRDRGVLARMVQDGRIENVYKVQLMNATERTLRVRIEVAGLPGATLESGGDVEVGPTEARWVPVAVQVPNDAARALGPGAHPMQFRICAGRAGRSDRRHASVGSTRRSRAAREVDVRRPALKENIACHRIPLCRRLDVTAPAPWWRFGIVWLVIGLPAAIVVAGFAMVAVAVRGADTQVPARSHPMPRRRRASSQRRRRRRCRPATMRPRRPSDGRRSR